MRQGLMQARLVLSLVELAKGPVEEIAGLARADREIAGAHIEEMQRVMAAIGDAAPERGRCSIITSRKGDAMRARQAIASPRP